MRVLPIIVLAATLIGESALAQRAVAAAPVTIEGPTWRLTSFSGQDLGVLADVPQGITARFAAGRLEGFSGCNQYTGTYTADGDRLTVGPLAATMMACAEPIMAIENAFRSAFAGTIQHTVAEGRLTLVSQSGATLVFQPEPAPSIEGVAWEVTGFNNGRQAVVSPLVGTTLTLSFRDGTVSGHAGCNTYRAGYTLEGTRITIGPVAATRKTCGGKGIMEQEQQFLAALQAATKWAIRGGLLDMHRADGERALTALAGKKS